MDRNAAVHRGFIVSHLAIGARAAAARRGAHRCDTILTGASQPSWTSYTSLYNPAVFSNTKSDFTPQSRAYRNLITEAGANPVIWLAGFPVAVSTA